MGFFNEGGAEAGPDDNKSNKTPAQQLSEIGNPLPQHTLSIDSLPLPGSTYTVSPGDTLWDIAETVLKINGNANPSSPEINAQKGEIIRSNPQYPDLANNPVSLQAYSELYIPTLDPGLILNTPWTDGSKDFVSAISNSSSVIKNANQQITEVDRASGSLPGKFYFVYDSSTSTGRLSQVTTDAGDSYVLQQNGQWLDNSGQIWSNVAVDSSGTITRIAADGSKIIDLSDGTEKTISTNGNIDMVNTVGGISRHAYIDQQTGVETIQIFPTLNGLGPGQTTILYPNGANVLVTTDQQGSLNSITALGVPGLSNVEGVPCTDFSMGPDGSGSFSYLDTHGNTVQAILDSSSNLVNLAYTNTVLKRMQAE